jgi:hypothetical protein
MADALPRLFHLPPPTGAGEFELHRFSPFFDQAATFGIEDAGASEVFRQVFAVPPDVADAMSYRHDFELRRELPVAEYTQRLHTAITEWKAANAAGASLEVEYSDGGGAVITDARQPGQAGQIHVLTGPEALVYRSMAVAQREHLILGVAATAGIPQGDCHQLLDRWDNSGLIWRSSQRVVALATDSELLARASATPGPTAAPLPYLAT